MPRSVLANVAVDHVCGLDMMAQLLNSLAKPQEIVTSVPAPEWLRIEHAISLGRSKLQGLATIGRPSSFTCPDCGGALFELNEGRPARFLCHTGHAFSLRSLASTQEQVTDEALWSGLRALQEKEAILRRVAEVQMTEANGSEIAVLAEADKLAAFIVRMRSMVTNAPAASADRIDVAAGQPEVEP